MFRSKSTFRLVCQTAEHSCGTALDGLVVECKISNQEVQALRL